MVSSLTMATYRKLLYTPSFSSQMSQTDKTSGRTGENSKHKLCRNMNRLTEATPSPLLFTKSPEITPRFLKKMKTNHLLRFYSNMRTSQKSTVNLRESEGGKLQRAERDARRGARGAQPLIQSYKTHKSSYKTQLCSSEWMQLHFSVCVCIGPSSDTFGFPQRDAQAVEEMVGLV